MNVLFLLLLATMPNWLLAVSPCLDMYRYQDEGEIPQKTCEEVPGSVYTALGLPSEGRVLLCEGTDFNNCESASEKSLLESETQPGPSDNPELGRKIDDLSQAVGSLQTPQGLKMFGNLVIFVSKRWPMLLGCSVLSFMSIQYANFKYDLGDDKTRWPLVLKLVGYLIPVGVFGYYVL